MANPPELGLESVTKKSTDTPLILNLNLADSITTSDPVSRVGRTPPDAKDLQTGSSPFKRRAAEEEAGDQQGASQGGKPPNVVCEGDKCYIPGKGPEKEKPGSGSSFKLVELDIVQPNDTTATAPPVATPDASKREKGVKTPAAEEAVPGGVTPIPDVVRQELPEVVFPEDLLFPGFQLESPAPDTTKETLSKVEVPAPREVQPVGVVGRDEAGLAQHLKYPDNRERHIHRENNQVTEITTKDAEGTLKLVKRDGHWYARSQGLESEFKGTVEVDDNTGDVKFGIGQNTSRIEKADGSIKLETVTTSGAVLSANERNVVDEVIRKDKSGVKLVDANTIMETSPDGKAITWKKESEQWTAEGQEPRTAFAINSDGSVSYEADGITHRITDAGAHSVRAEGHATLHLDETGHVKGATTADGKHERSYKPFGETSDLQVVTLEDKTNGQIRTYTRASSDSLAWNVTDEKGRAMGVWHGEVKLDNDGTHSVRSCATDSFGRPIKPGQNDKWTVYGTDGSVTKQQFNADKTRSTFNGDNLVAFNGNGTKIELAEADGQPVIKISDTASGTTVSWTRGADSQWRSDAKESTEVRKDMKFTSTGDLSYETSRSEKVTVHNDKSTTVVGADKIVLDYNASNELVSSRKGDQQRTYVHKDGAVASVTERDLRTKQERVIFERKPANEETRTHIALSSNGELSYQNADGTAVIERTDGLHLELDPSGDTTKVVNGNLTRDFKYLGEGANKTLVEIKDSRPHGSSTYAETWTRRANEDGSLSDTYEGKNSLGQDLPARCGLTPCADGEYEYRLADEAEGSVAKVAKMSMPELARTSATIERPVTTDRALSASPAPVIERASVPQCNGRVCDNRAVYRSQVEIPSGCPTMRPATPTCTPGGSCAPRTIGTPYYSGNQYRTSWSSCSPCNSNYSQGRPVMNFIRGGRRR